MILILRTSNFNGSIATYLKSSDFTGSIATYLKSSDFNGSIATYLKTVDYNMTHSNIVSSLDAQANLSGAIFTGNINAPVVDAFNLRENGTNISSMYAYSSIVDDNKDISDQKFAEVQSMIQSGNGSVSETTTTILKYKRAIESSIVDASSDACIPHADNHEQHIEYQFYY